MSEKARVIKTYLLGVKDGRHGCGTNFTRVYSCLTNSYSYYESRVQTIALEFKEMHQHDEVYAVNQYTQKMCEMNPIEFTEYLKTNGQKVA